MTAPADALRVVMGKVNAVSDGDWLSRLVNEYETAYDCADFLRDHGPAIAQALEDARRYRWLREHCYTSRSDERGFPHAVIAVSLGESKDGKWVEWMHPGHTVGVGVPSLDTAIDAAIAATEAAHD